ncbi:transposase family protein [Streptomyces coelicoflavus]|uniref:Transposase family protein n=1 Tax=Streptomyces coelicoflavus TaxID=285562 RepID=A0A6N9UXU4_9ACTN|nr:transposase family protein [Streptomyces coelicoflavus]NEB21386.1 transposase family protein [Streptomyces coelicoflavus]
MAGVISASEPSWPGPFTGLSPRCFTKLVTALWREGADAVRKGRPWSLPLEDRVLLVAAYWRTSRAWEESGAKAAVGKTTTIADGGYPGTGLVTPHRRRQGEELPDWKQEHYKSHKQARARVEHSFARMKGWKILRDCRLKGDGVHHAVPGIARLHNVALAG